MAGRGVNIFDTPGWNHGEYQADEIDVQYGELGSSFGIDYAKAPLGTDFFNFISPSELWIAIESKYQFAADTLEFKYKGYDNSTPIPNEEEWSNNHNVLADIFIGQFQASDHFSSTSEKTNVSIQYTSSTLLASNVNIDDLFIPDPFDRWNTKNIKLTTPFTLVSGTRYAIRIIPKLLVGGNSFGVTEQLSRMNSDPTFYNFCRNNFPWVKRCVLAGSRISVDASPSPIAYRYMYQLNDPVNARDITWIGNAWVRNYYVNDRVAFPDLTLLDKDMANSAQGFEVLVKDTNNNYLYDSRHIGFTRVPPYSADYRFSTDGIDALLGYNPNVWSHYATRWMVKIPQMGELIPEANNFTLLISGLNIRLEGISVSKQSSMSPKFKFSTKNNLFSLNTENITDDIRNDVIVVGNLQGVVQDPESQKTLNPNNPTYDYIYSRAIDLSSIGRLGVENSMGKSIPFLIYEPNIKDQEHIDYLAFAVLDRYRKVQNQVSFNGMLVPFLDLEDAIMVVDDRYVSNTNNQIQWIESISENITSDKYEMSFQATPLAPWPSFVPKLPPDINDFKASDDSRPQLIINVSMTDMRDLGRSDDLAVPHNVNFDPYETEGAAVISDAANGYPENRLKCAFTLLANADIRVGVKILDNAEIPTETIVVWLIGGKTEDGFDLFEKRDWGNYAEYWDAIDYHGTSRTPIQASAEGIRVGSLAGIYAKATGTRYHVFFEVKSHDEDDHNVRGAPRQYDSGNLPTLGLNGLPLNANNSTLGFSFPWNSIHRKGQLWQLTIGARSQAVIRSNSTPTTTHQQLAFPGGTANATQIKGKQFTAFDDDLQVWLQAFGPGYYGNRSVSYRVKIEEGSCFFIPTEELLQHDVGTGTDDYSASLLQPRLIATPGDEASTEVFPSAARSGDSGISVSSGSTNDETYFIYPVFCQNRVRGEIPGVPGLDRTGEFIKIKQLETRVNFNPMVYGLYFNQVPRSDYFSLKESATTTRSQIPVPPPFGTNVLLGFKAHCWIYMARWINVYFQAFDRSGRTVTSNEIWSDRNGFGIISESSGLPNAGWLSTRCIWIPHGTNDMIGSNHQYMDVPKPLTWVNASDYDNNTVKRVSVGGYTGLKDSEVPTPSTIDIHTYMVMHTDNPHGAMGDMKNINNLTYFRDNFGEFGFYAWPIWNFWKPVAGGSNYTLRTVLGDGSSNFMGDPPFETIRD